jgi:peptidoglycan-associated lipoprotein
MTYRNLKLYMFVCVLVAITCGGCRSSKDLGGDSLNPEILPGDIGLNQRFEDGIRVPASEFNIAPILFAYDSFRIKPSDMATIARIAGFMRSNRDVRLIVEGHCDERGSRDYNISLGEHRALAIRAALIGDQNISSKRVQTRSFGEEMPVDARHHDGAWRMNRRGSFALYR